MHPLILNLLVVVVAFFVFVFLGVSRPIHVNIHGDDEGHPVIQVEIELLQVQGKKTIAYEGSDAAKSVTRTSNSGGLVVV